MSDRPRPPLEATEARLRASVAERTARVQPDEESGLRSIEDRLHAAGRSRWWATRALAVAAVVTLIAIAVPALVRDTGREQVSTTGPDESTTTSPAVTTTITALPRAPGSLPVWPPPDHEPYPTPESTARSFVEEYVGMGDPPLSDVRGSKDEAEVDVYLRGEGGEVLLDRVVSTVSLLRIGGDWIVTGARTDDIVVDNPLAGSAVGRRVVVDGKGRGYEGTIVVSVRDTGMGADRSLGTGVATAGCCEERLPFHLEIEIAEPAHPLGSLLLATDSGIAPVSSFAAIPVTFAGPGAPNPQPSDQTTVKVGWTAASGEVVTMDRTVRISGGVLRGALQQLLSGPTAEERDSGLSSALATEAAGVPFDVVIDNGRAVVDFGADLPRVSPGTSSSEASGRFLRQLHATVFQFPTVTSAEYRVAGSCEAFWAWLQRPCTVVDRSDPGT